MAVRKRTTTFKRSLKTPPSISPSETDLQNSAPTEETPVADTQMPQSKPFEVNVEVEKAEVQPPVAAQDQEPEAPEPPPPSSQTPEETPPVVEQTPPPSSRPEGLRLEVEKSSSGPSLKKLVWLFLLLGLLVFIGLGIYTYAKTMRSLSAPSPAPTTAAENSPTSSPTSSPSAQLNRSDLKIQVLNGTSVSGLAAGAKTYLVGLGYQNVAVGNADRNDLTETTIAIANAKKDYLRLLTTDLSSKYPLAKTPQTLDSSSPYDAVITLGQP